MVVLDSSAAVDYLIGTELGAWVAERLVDAGDLHAPHVLDVEVVGVLRRLVRGGRLPQRRARLILDDLLDLRVRRYPHVPFIQRMWQLRENVSPRDAAFVALAEALDAPLLTTDARLSRAPALRVRIIAP